MSGLVIAATAVSAVVFLGLVAVLVFCAFAVVRTGNTAGLRDVAVVLRAYASIGSLRRGRT